MCRVDLDHAVRLHNRFMVGFDLALGSGALLAPDQTLLALGHAEPSPDARWLFRRCGPIWLTFAAAHAVADRRGEPQDWWALAWLRGDRARHRPRVGALGLVRRARAGGDGLRRRGEPGDDRRLRLEGSPELARPGYW